MGDSSWKVEPLLIGSWRGATSVLISNGRHHLIVDTGMPHEAPLLLKSLEERGLKPTDIRYVLNTHFHIDHALNNQLFPASAIYGSQRSYEWCRALYQDLCDDLNWEKLILKYYPEIHDYRRARELMGTLRKIVLRWWDAKRLGDPSRFRWIENHPLPEGLENLITSGHVPGHISLIVRNREQNIVIAGDALLSRHDDAEIMTMIPHNREEFHRDRNRILAMHGRIVPGHGSEFSTEAPTGEES